MTDYQLVHKNRYQNTIDILVNQSVLFDGMKILNIGESRGIAPWLEDFPIIDTEGDVRFGLKHEDESFDLVLCLEVIEHIKDLPTGDLEMDAAFLGNGIVKVLTECSRVLKPGGYLLLSTPNVHCFRTLINWLNRDELMTFAPHPRELTEKYLVSQLEPHFTTVRPIYKFSWNCHGAIRTDLPLIERIEEFLEIEGLDNTNRRNDNLFILCQK